MRFPNIARRRGSVNDDHGQERYILYRLVGLSVVQMSGVVKIVWDYRGRSPRFDAVLRKKGLA